MMKFTTANQQHMRILINLRSMKHVWIKLKILRQHPNMINIYIYIFIFLLGFLLIYINTALLYSVSISTIIIPWLSLSFCCVYKKLYLRRHMLSAELLFHLKKLKRYLCWFFLDYAPPSVQRCICKLYKQ